MDGVRLSHFNGGSELENSVVNFMMQTISKRSWQTFCVLNKVRRLSRCVPYFPCFEEQIRKLPLVAISERTQ